MNEEKRPSADEVQFLADAAFDSHASLHQLQRLDELISSDLGCLQAYVERIGFHSDLMKQATERNSLRQAESALDRILNSRVRREKRERLILRSVVGACAALVVGVIAWVATTPRPLAPQVGIIASLTTDVVSQKSSMELGQVIREGGVYSIDSGILSVQLPNVTVDLIGPTTIELTNATQVLLRQGTLHALVQSGGEGFTVRTPGSVVVDLGTEFTVGYQQERGTEVNVSRGRVQASLLDRHGNSTKLQEVTDRRALHLSERQATVKEVNFSSENFLLIEQARGTIRSIDGALRTMTKAPPSLKAEELQTTNHKLVIPEQQNVVLEQELTLNGLDGPVHLPAGTRLASYLVHYDPDDWTTFAPRGAVTFDGTIAAVIVDGANLLATDSIFGLSETRYEPGKFRELELDEDEVRLSNDRKTVSFYFGVSGGKSIDQTRILVFR